MFYFDKIKDKKILKSDLIDNVFFTTRESFIKTEEPEMLKTAERNKNEIKKFLYTERLICPAQVHGKNIEIFSPEKDNYPETDALIICNRDNEYRQKSGLSDSSVNFAIYLNFADCTPLVFYDKKQNVGAIAHAGWRGTVAKIGVMTVKKMVKELGCNVKNISALIGPCICESCFEVGNDVFEKLYASVDEFLPKINDNAKTKNNKYFANLKEINKKQLEKTGIEKIDVCPYCTVCDNNLFFSYRKENSTSSRHSALMSLRHN